MYETLLLVALAILAFCAFKSTISYVIKNSNLCNVNSYNIKYITLIKKL